MQHKQSASTSIASAKTSPKNKKTDSDSPDGTPPWSATLSRWWGFTLITRKISEIWRVGANSIKSWPNPWEQICYTLPVFCAGFGFTADYGFTAIYLWLHSHLRLYSRYL